MNFSERTDRLAERLGVALKDLPEKIGVSPDMFWGYRSGRYPISRKALGKLETSERDAGIEPPFDAHLRRIGTAAEHARTPEEVDELVERITMLEQMVGPRARLASALRKRGWTPADLAKRIGYDAGVIENVVRNGGKASQAMLEKIARVLPELPLEDLMSGSEHPLLLSDTEGTYGQKPALVLPPGMTGRMVPLLSMAQAGGWDAGHSDEGWQGECIVALNVDDRRAFAIKVVGNSMEPEIREGDMVICSPDKRPTPGCVAVVRTKSDQAFVKFWKSKGEVVILESANPAYAPIKFPAAEIAGAWPVVQRISSGMIRKHIP